MNFYLPVPARLLAFAFLLTLPAAARADMVSGEVENVTGNATLMTAGGQTIKITSGTRIMVGSQLQTGPDAKVGITWMPGATSVVAPKSNLSVVALDYAEKYGKPERKIVLHLTRGTVYSKLAHGTDEGISDFRIKTPKGVARATGTEWEVTVTDDGAVTISVTLDIVGFTFNSGAHINIQQGYLFAVTDGGLPVPLTQTQINAIVTALNGSGFTVVLPADLTTFDTDANLLTPLGETPLPKVFITSH